MKKLYLLFLMLLILFIPGTHAVAVYQLDQPVKELNNHTLREVFETNQILLNNNFDDDTAWGVQNGVVAVFDNSEVIFQNFDSYTGIRQTVSYINNNQYYYIFRAKGDGTLQINTANTGINEYILTNNYTLYSFEYIKNPIMLDYFGLANVQVNKTTYLDYIYLIDKTALGITNLTKEQMDTYYDLYLEAVRFYNENIEAGQDPGGYQNIFKSIINGVKSLMQEMGYVWAFLNAPILTNDMQNYQFNIDWSWDLIGVLRQIINSLAILILQVNFLFINLLFSFTGIPIQISILSLIFSNFVFVILGWITIKSFII